MAHRVKCCMEKDVNELQINYEKGEKRMKKGRNIVLAVILTMSFVIGGCSSEKLSDTSEESSVEMTNSPDSQKEESTYPAYLNMDSEYPIIKDGENVTLSVATVYNSSQGGKTEDMWFWKWCEKKMNVNLEVEQIMDTAIAEKKNLLLASGELKDIMFNFGISTTDLVTYGQTEQRLYNVKELITPELMPNLCALAEEIPALLPTLTCPDGGIYSFPKIGLINDPGSVDRIFINEEWLEEVGMSMPETLDEFYEVLKAFKAQIKVEGKDVIPLGGNYANYDPSFIVLRALGFITSTELTREAGTELIQPALRNGKVEIPCGNELYKEYLIFMNKLYEEGLIDPNFYTLDKTQADAQLAEKRVGVMAMDGAPYLVLPNVEDFQKYPALSPLTSNFNDTKICSATNPVVIGSIVLSAECEHPEAAARFIDYLYSQEGSVYCWNGAPATHEEDTLGMYQGWSIADDGSEYYPDVAAGKYDNAFDIIVGQISPFNTTMGNRSDILNDKRVLSGLEALDEPEYSPENGDGFFRISATKNLLPYLTEGFPSVLYFSEEENIQLNDLKTVIGDFVNKETAKFITGANSLDNIDKYYADLNALGFDEYLEIYEKAYENYTNNK